MLIHNAASGIFSEAALVIIAADYLKGSKSNVNGSRLRTTFAQASDSQLLPAHVRAE